jgi:hypothetical protein
MADDVERDRQQSGEPGQKGGQSGHQSGEPGQKKSGQDTDQDENERLDRQRRAS